MPGKKRYCKTLQLQNDPVLIEKYKQVHSPGAACPEVTQGMLEVGITDKEIYIYGNLLFMIMETTSDFDYDKAMDELARRPSQKEWEAYVSRFQQTSSEAAAAEKWQLMERIYKLEK